MELKRIIARDSRAANDKAIQLYGPEVLVISSQRVDNQTELIVAIDTAPQEPAQATAPTISDGRAQARAQAFADVFKVSVEQPASDSAEEDWTPAAWHLSNPAERGVTSASPAPQAALSMTEAQAVSLALSPAPSPQMAPDERLQVPPAILAPQATAAMAQTFNPAPAAHELPHDTADLLRSRDTVELLRQEIAALRQEFNLNRQVAMWQSGQGLSPELTQWFAQMQELGVPASLRTLMVDAAGEAVTVSEAWPLIHQTLTDAMARRKSPWPSQGVHALLGPSGAGKTLMVARMALAASAQSPVEQMAIISLGDTKPGAWSQLQVLAAQSGVSCYRAADGATLEVLLQELSHLRAVWIDTAGNDFLTQARSLHAAAPQIALHAVLPLDATVTNVQKVFDSTEINWASMMLTKLDEAAHPWPVLKALCERPLAVSAVGTSHLARTEPQPFDAQAIVDLAMQGLRPEGVTVTAPVKKPRRRASPTKTKALHG